jgi:tetraprenyl-beta-curcumene synthase
MAAAARRTGRVGEVRAVVASARADRPSTTRAGAALLLANVRYWPTVAPLVRVQLNRWERHARAIPDPVLKALALQKLDEEGFNAEVAATLATLAPRARRARVVEAVVALEVMYDYLDGLTEQPAPDPQRNGRQLFKAFTDAVTLGVVPDRDYYRYSPRVNDGNYLRQLAGVVTLMLSQLPASAAVAKVAYTSAARCAEAQVRVHTQHRQSDQLQDWAAQEATGSALRWQEWLAGAVASVLTVHALIAAAADPRTTPRHAAEIDRTYLSISALSTLLDSLVDYRHDARTGTPSHLQCYPDHHLLSLSLIHLSRHAAAQALALPNAAHHVMTLIGVAAYYTSAPAASQEPARQLLTQIQDELQPLIVPTLGLMRTWRRAKCLRHPQRWRRAASGSSAT